MKKLILFASISIASGLLFANLYTSVVDVRSWQHDIPNSIATAREYFKVSDPGDFFRIFSPVNQVLGLLALILFWKSSSSVRLYLGTALGMYLLAEGLTFGFFFPRNDFLFKTASLTDIESLKKTVSDWSAMNMVRTGILVVGVFFSWLSLHKINSLHRN